MLLEHLLYLFALGERYARRDRVLGAREAREKLTTAYVWDGVQRGYKCGGERMRTEGR